MRINKFISAAAFLVVLILAPSLMSCKGRTAENMEPTGDTVEVNIANHDDLVTTLPDSIPVPE